LLVFIIELIFSVTINCFCERTEQVQNTSLSLWHVLVINWWADLFPPEKWFYMYMHLLFSGQICIMLCLWYTCTFTLFKMSVNRTCSCTLILSFGLIGVFVAIATFLCCTLCEVVNYDNITALPACSQFFTPLAKTKWHTKCLICSIIICKTALCSCTCKFKCFLGRQNDFHN